MTDKKDEYPVMEEILYRMNGTLMNINKTLQDIKREMERR